MDALTRPDVLQFDRFRLHRRDGRLLRKNESGAWQPVAIGSRALEALGLLLERHDDLVSKEDLIRVVWSGAAVEDSNLTVQISALRRVLDEGRGGESCIQTVTGKGYRFVFPVTQTDEMQGRPVSTQAAAPTTPYTPVPARESRLALAWRGIGWSGGRCVGGHRDLARWLVRHTGRTATSVDRWYCLSIT